ncbi:amino acid permease [Streptomyces scabiei]|uniref:amino acid permease n=1 Tax=Streptomyces scabiei TaxID=1930 RepID=UPI001B3083E9|nr:MULTISPECIES: amino acid permease [Streptomyces]MDX3028144.1 amino acid permease [Streptomyces scabiei]
MTKGGVADVVEAASPGSEDDEDSTALGGYQQELKRTLGSFQVFAVSFAFISVAVGIFSTYDDVLQNAGPVGIWLWVIATVGQVLVALVVAQLAGRIPLSGSSYQWASRLANPKVGWGFGWLSFCYLAIAVVAIDNALASQAFMPLVGLRPDEDTARVITLVILLVQAVVVVASTRLVSLINTTAVGWSWRWSWWWRSPLPSRWRSPAMARPAT